MAFRSAFTGFLGQGRFSACPERRCCIEPVRRGPALEIARAGQANGNVVDIWTANNTGVQSWVFSNVDVVPSGFYNIAVSYGPYCLTANGSDPNSSVNLQGCNGSSGQFWEVTGSSGNYQLHPATNTALCLDVYCGSRAPRTSMHSGSA